MNIGEAARASGLSQKMVRYYEEIGLIKTVARSGNSYRVYSDKDVHRLRFIKRARDMGFSMAETSTLLALWQDKSRASSEVKEIALAHVHELEERIAQLQSMARTLKHLAGACHGDHRPDCPILDDIAGEHPPGCH